MYRRTAVRGSIGLQVSPLHHLATLCAILADVRGGRLHLGGDAVVMALRDNDIRIDWRTVFRLLNRLVADGLLVMVRPASWKARRAAEYLYLGPID